jgi:hypothetical protein
MSDCSCITVDPDHIAEEHEADFLRAGTEYRCAECYRPIRRGELYERVLCRWDDTDHVYQTCSDCVSVRDEFFCGGYIYQEVWEKLREHIWETDGNIASECLIKLTSAAREMVCEIIQEIWDDTNYEELRDEINKKVLEWSPRESKRCEEYAEKIDDLLDKRVPEYAQALDLSEVQVLGAIERKRNYSIVNYYQDANFPSLEDVRVFDSEEAFFAAFPSKQFRCPACKGISTNPYECNSGKPMDPSKDAKICDWKSYGLFHTLGKGLRFTFKDRFLDCGTIGEIFLPIELEG